MIMLNTMGRLSINIDWRTREALIYNLDQMTKGIAADIDFTDCLHEVDKIITPILRNYLSSKSRESMNELQ